MKLTSRNDIFQWKMRIWLDLHRNAIILFKIMSTKYLWKANARSLSSYLLI